MLAPKTLPPELPLPTQPSPHTRRAAWTSYLAASGSRYEIVGSVALLVIVMAVFAQFLGFVEARPGATLDDPILQHLARIDLTWVIFPLIYGSVIAAIVLLSAHPKRLVFALQLYALVVASRMLAMYLLPLDPPAQMILLRDPVVELFATGDAPTRDLFFSGHTATMFMLYLTAESRTARKVFLLLSFVIAAALLLQHVHYTVDVLAAFVFVYAGDDLLRRMKGKLAAINGNGHGVHH
ncbi:MAG: hypothetical protein COW59_02440 [Lysobacterales bacterium CG17_big_fil_post_rev_8_21_14_2_50_64_11]|nr:MAG: hypothetical protein COW59_02440 [Xanthomonadales bacterium CG17_big_fil_post_rev_8_21_14_2_50_64_11]PIX61310.1 MAG: hypothetical protein COZ47_02575 [Xanthomonadales bacterium CG_4_10_14_3_um_filter_64_11]